MSCFKYIIFLFLTFLSSLCGKVWTDCSEAFEIASQPVEVVAQNVVLPGPAEIDYKAGLGKEFREALGDRKDINWQAVQDNYREWSEHTTTLSRPARMLVACVLTAVTNGMGTTEWLASHGIAEGTSINAALSAGIQGVVVGAGTSLAGNLGDIGKTFDELTSADFVKGLASTMLTAGLNLNEANSLKEGIVKGAEKIAIQTTLEGKNLGEILVGNIVNANAGKIAEKIGDAKAAGNLNPVAHKALHAGLGAASKALTGGDALAGAIGAAASETAAEAMDKPNATHEERQQIAQKARIIGDTVAFLAGRDVASADSAGRTAVENNSLMHPEASMKIAMAVQDESLTEEKRSKKIDAAIEEGKAQDEIYIATMGFAAAPGITSGYFATQSLARWAGTYAGGGMEAVKQEFREHPILNTVDLATAGMLGAGFVKGMTKPGLQVMSKQPATRIYQPTPEQSALSLQYGNKGMKGTLEYKSLVDKAPARHTEHVINGRRFCDHAVDQMQNRGIPPSAVENTISVGKKEFSGGKLLYYDKENNITVITETNGDVVSTYYGKGRAKK